MRRFVSALVPAACKHWLDGRRVARFMATVRPATRRFVSQHGLEVRRGPLAGLRYTPDLVDTSGDLVAKLAGTYEQELHGALERWISDAPQLIVDVGAAEGTYAVGLAVAIPGARVLAFDIDAQARARCSALAKLNDVADRVEVRGACTPETLRGLPGDVALFLDCEGYERVLLDPALVPELRHWPIIVELHDFLDEGITATIADRFAGTHDVEIVDSTDRDPRLVPELVDFEAVEQAALLSEFRPGPMRWGVLTPRA